MKLAIALLVSHGFPAPSEFWDSYEAVMHHIRSGAANQLLPPELQITDIRRIKATSFPVDLARNDIVRSFLDQGSESHLVFMDADMTFPPDWIPRLLLHDVPVISARYHMRKPPYHPCFYVKHRVAEGPHTYAPVHYGQGLIEIERGGAGALIVRRDVFEAIRFRIGDNWFRYQRGPSDPFDMSVSEDFWFYRAAREAGYACYGDWDVECLHLQTMAIDRSWNQAYLDGQVRELPTMTPEARQTVLNSLVVCGFPDGMSLPTGDHIPPYVLSPGER